MNLRRSRLDDHWRHALEHQSSTRLESVTFERLSCLRDDSIRFQSGINAIVGSNGVGKSTLLAAIAELLTGEPVQDAIGHLRRLAGSRLEAVVVRHGGQIALSVRDDGTGKRPAAAPRFEGATRWLEPSYLAVQCCELIHDDQNFGDNLEPLTPISLAGDELEMASYIVGKQYTLCEIFEILEYGVFERMPYFRVTCDGITYGTESMGQGELSLMLVYWTLRDLAKHSILILEEPETHVSPRSQAALMDIVAKFCDEKNLWIVITTHSPSIVTRLPRANIRLIAKDTGPAIVIENPSNTQVALLLGGGVAFRGAFLVEDAGARSLLLALLQEIDPDLSLQFEIVAAGSEGGITEALTSMPLTKHWLRIVGIYDGDMREKVNRTKHKWPSTFLPSAMNPEEMLIDAYRNTLNGSTLLAKDVSREGAQIVAATNAAHGLDPHDWIFEVAMALTLEPQALTKSLFRLWLAQGENRKVALDFCTELRTLINA